VRRPVPTWPSVAVLTLIGLPYLATTTVIAHRRHLWNDELYTYYFARLPSLGDVWHELAKGVEQTPPLFYVITRAALWAFGDNTVAIRVSEILGVLAACCILFVVVARRTSVAGGAIAPLVILATSALQYGYEARPYGLVLAFAAVALLCWQERTDGAGLVAVGGLAVALAAAVSTHYYAVFLVVPLLAGELVRTLQRKRWDVPVLAALGLGLAPLVAYAPLIRGARRYSGHFWTQFDWGSAATFYAWLLRTPAIPPSIGTNVLVAFVAVVVGAALVILAAPSFKSTTVPLDAPLVAAALGFLAIPLLAVAAAEAVTGAFSERYTLSAVIGLAVLVPLAVERLRAWWKPLSVVVALMLGIFVSRALVYDYRDVTQDLRSQQATVRLLEDDPSTRLPILVADPHDFFELSRYAPAPLRRRLFHVTSQKLELRYTNTDSAEAGLVVLSRFAPLHIRGYRDWLSARRPFLLLVATGRVVDPNWVVPALQSDGRILTLRTRANGRALYLVPAS
jgi:Dolichyl-phosphate-mannose-protein mannosyltransferase